MNRQSKCRLNSETLDIEFKKILCAIREHIPFINSNAYLMQCRVWLEKLSSFDENKVLRNLYLLELSEQIQKNKLLPPFNEAPPSGPLKSLARISLDRKSHKLLIQDLERKRTRQYYAHPDSLSYIEEHGKHFGRHIKKKIDSVDVSKLDRNMSRMSVTQKIKHDRLIPIKIKRQKSSNANIGKLQNQSLDCGEPISIERNDTHEVFSNNNSNNDSWSDLTDDSINVEIPPRQDNEPNMLVCNDNMLICSDNMSLNIDVGTTKSQNDLLTGVLMMDPDYQLKRADFSNIKAIHVFSTFSHIDEINQKIPKDTNYISEDWKNTIRALQLRLSEITQQNTNLNAVIQKMDSKMEEIETENKAESQKVKAEHQEQIDKVICSYEQKLIDINKHNDELIKRKDDDICRLTEVIQQQCVRITNDISSLHDQVSSCNCDKKLHLLKKCVSKMDKLFQKSEKEYIKQIDKLQQELEIKNTALQIQVKLQKAELLAETSTERQEEFEKILNTLEVKYIKMLEMHENQIMEMKKHDDAKIQSLKEILSKHGIIYEEHDM